MAILLDLIDLWYLATQLTHFFGLLFDCCLLDVNLIGAAGRKKQGCNNNEKFSNSLFTFEHKGLDLSLVGQNVSSVIHAQLLVALIDIMLLVLFSLLICNGVIQLKSMDSHRGKTIVCKAHTLG